MIRRTFLASVGSLALVPACRIEATGAELTQQQRAPEFSLPDQRGQVVSLASLHARGPAILVFYRGAW